MNKLLTKIVGAALGLSMTVGVGVAIASNESFARTDAASGDSFTFTAVSGTSTDSKWSYSTAKNNASTAPQMSSGQLRIYPKGTITFTAAANVTLNSASFTCAINKNNKNVYPTGWGVDNGSITSFATSLTSFSVTGIDSSSFTITINGSAGNVGLKTVTMNYTNSSTAVVDSVSLTGDATKNASGAETVTADYLYEVVFSSGSGNEGVNVSVSPSQGATIGTVENGEFSITYAANGTYTVTATSIEDSTKSNTFDTVVSGISQVIYEKVTNVSSLKAGKQVIIGQSDGAFVMGTYSGGNNIPALVSTPNGSGNLVSAMLPSGYSLFTLAGSSDAWKFEIGGEYLHDPNTSEKNYLYVDSTQDAWSVSISGEGVATITNNSSSKVVKKNSSSAAFGCYGSGQHDVALFMIPSTDPAIEIEVTGETTLGVGQTATLTANKLYGATGTVNWATSDASKVSISAATGDSITVTGVAKGSATITASLTGCDDATQLISVVNGTQSSPYSVAEARAAIDAGQGIIDVYTSGIIAEIDSFNDSDKSITYWISDDGSTTDMLEVYSGLNIGNTQFSSINDIVAGATVTVFGTLKKYNSTYEYSKGNYLTAYVAPTFTLTAITGIDGTLSAASGDASWDLSGLTPKGSFSNGKTNQDISAYVDLTTSDVPGTVQTTTNRQVSVTVTPKDGSLSALTTSINVSGTINVYTGPLTNGGRYYIMNSDKTYGLSATDSSSESPVAVSLSSANSLLPFDVRLTANNTYEFTTTISSTKYYLVCNTTSTSGSNSSIRITSSPLAGLATKGWLLDNTDVEEPGAYHLSENTTGSTHRYLTYYTDSSTKWDWRGYISLTPGGTAITDNEIQFVEEGYYSDLIANALLSNSLCDGGTTPPSTTTWNNIAATTTIANEKNILKNVVATPRAVDGSASSGNARADAMARYDYIVGKYGSSTYTDFLDRNPSAPSGSRINLFDSSSSNSVAIISIIAVLSLSAVAGFFMLRKRKEQ